MTCFLKGDKDKPVLVHPLLPSVVHHRHLQQQQHQQEQQQW